MPAGGPDTPPPGAGPPDAFISYAREQKELAGRLEEAFRARGKSVWIDWKDIPPTADWRAEVRAAIEKARAFVFVLSPESLSSEICEEELVHAIGSNKRIVPVVGADVDPKRAPEQLAAPNWIFFRPEDDFDASVGILIEALETDLDWLDDHARLLVRASEWKTERFDSSYLLRGKDLAAAEAWLAEEAEHREQASQLQREYVTASREAADRRRRLVIGSASLAAVVAAGLAIFAWQQRERAGTESDKAESSSLAAASIAEVRGDPWEALELAIEAREASDTPEATDALRRALEAPRESAVLELPGTAIRSAEFTPDSEHVLTTSFDNVRSFEVRRWNLATGESEVVRRLRSLPLKPPPSGDLSPDGALRVAAQIHGVRLSDAEVGTPLIELNRLGLVVEGAFPAAEFSPDGRSFLSVAYDRAARVWPLTLRRLAETRAVAAAASPGERIAENPVVAAAISPDGKRCLTANSDVTATLWSCGDGEKLRSWPLPEPESGNRLLSGDARASFLGDGSRIAASVGSTTTVSDADSGEELYRVRGAPGLGTSPSISPSGSLAFRALPDQSAEIVELPGEHRVDALPPNYPYSGQGVFSEDDRRLVVAYRNDPRVRIWDVERGEEIATIGPFEAPVEDVDLSADGSLVLTASQTSAELWDAASGERLRALEGQDQVFTAAFAADERFVVTTAADPGVSRVWETSTGRPVATHSVDPFVVGDASMGADGRLLAWGLRGSALVFDCAACLPPSELLAEARAAIEDRPAQSAPGE